MLLDVAWSLGSSVLHVGAYITWKSTQTSVQKFGIFGISIGTAIRRIKTFSWDKTLTESLHFNLYFSIVRQK